jgi:Mg-chelatase subunit ChlI
VSNEPSRQIKALGSHILAPPGRDVVGKVRVVYGIHALSVGVAGKTVSEVRVALGQAMNVSPRAIALVNGQEVSESQILLPGQHLEFVRQAGEKGRSSRPIFPFSAILGQEKMKKALVLNAIDPSIGGVLIRGQKGTAKSTAVRGIAELLPPRLVVQGCAFACHPDQKEGLCPDCQAKVARREKLPLHAASTPVVDLPLNASEDRVVGSIDIEAALKTGEQRFQPGILASAHRAILYVDEVNLLDDHIVDVLLDVAVTGINLVEREGVSYAHPCRFILVGTMNPEEGELRPQLLDRFGLCVEIETDQSREHRKEIAQRALTFQTDPEGFRLVWQASQEVLQAEIARAREVLPTLTPSDALLSFAAEVAEEMKVDGHRAEITMAKAALAAAAFRGAEAPTPADLRDLMDLSLRHRVKRLPFQEKAFDAKTLDRLAEAFADRRHL